MINIFKKKSKSERKPVELKTTKTNEQIATRKGELGEYKIDIQLDQLPKDSRYLSDLMIKNPKARSGYSQIDHVVLTPYGIFVIETKNYQGIIYGGKNRKTWLVNGKFKMMNPFVQNYGHIKSLAALIDQKYRDLFISMVSFTKRAKFKVDINYRQIASDEIIVYDVELSDFIHRKLRVLKLHNEQPLLNENDIATIYRSFADANITDPKARKEHETALKQQPAPRSTCTVCEKPVSEKVKMFCLSNSKFKGKIYCYEHQKTVK